MLKRVIGAPPGTITSLLESFVTTLVRASDSGCEVAADILTDPLVTKPTAKKIYNLQAIV